MDTSDSVDLEIRRKISPWLSQWIISCRYCFIENSSHKVSPYSNSCACRKISEYLEEPRLNLDSLYYIIFVLISSVWAKYNCAPGQTVTDHDLPRSLFPTVFQKSRDRYVVEMTLKGLRFSRYAYYSITSY